MRSQESGVRSQESGVRSQESGVRSQESGVRSLYRIHFSPAYSVPEGFRRTPFMVIKRRLLSPNS